MRSMWPGFGDTGLRLSRSSAEHQRLLEKGNRSKVKKQGDAHCILKSLMCTLLHLLYHKRVSSIFLDPNGFAPLDRVICTGTENYGNRRFASTFITFEAASADNDLDSESRDV